MKYSECLVDYCSRLRAVRGLCTSHYRAAHKLIHEGKTSWGKLEESGKVLQSLRPAPGQGKAEKWFLGK